MGTRHFIGVKKDGEFKIAQYGQWDGYYSGQGEVVLAFLREHGLKGLEKNLPRCQFMTPRQLEDASNEIQTGLKSIAKDFPFLSRDHGAKILEMVAQAPGTGPILLKDASYFPADSLFCEYAYVIDLDAETFEVYEGFNKVPLDPDEPFYSLEQKRLRGELDGVKSSSEYTAVRLVKRYSVWEIPENLNELQPQEAES